MLCKRIVSFLLSVAVVGSVAAVSSSAAVQTDVLYGDANNDSKINSSDALEILNYSVGNSELSEAAFARSDVNADGKVNSSDAIDILKYSVGLIDGFAADGTQLDAAGALSAVSKAVEKVSTARPSYTQKQRAVDIADEVKLSGLYVSLLPSSVIKDYENQMKEEINSDRTYTKIVKPNSNDCTKYMINSLDGFTVDSFKSVSFSKNSDGNLTVQLAFKDESNPGANSPYVKIFGYKSYSEAQAALGDSSSMDGAEVKVDSFKLSYKGGTLNCVINPQSYEIISMEYFAKTVTEAKMSYEGLNVSMKMTHNDTVNYSNFGY